MILATTWKNPLLVPPPARGKNPSDVYAQEPSSIWYTDMQIAPNCTMREVYNKVIRCMRPLLAGYPYSERTTCEWAANHCFSAIKSFIN